MRSFISLVCAVEYIENHLRGKISISDVAMAAYLSLSHLQSMFSRTFQLSIGEYIVKRRLCAAAKELVTTDSSITDIAFDFGYANAESFTRAFKKQFLHAPSVYRKSHSFSELYPKLMIKEKEGFDQMKRYDLTEISEKILASKGTYIISADIDRMDAINKNLGRPAGDAAIAETAARLSSSIQENMYIFRISGDQFAVLTNSSDVSVAQEIARKVIALSDRDVTLNGCCFKFTISMGIVMIPLDISDAKAAIDSADSAMLAAKKEGRNCFATT